MKNKRNIVMHKLIQILITICFVMQFNHNVNAGGVDIAKEETALLDREKIKQLIQSMREGNYTNTGGAEAVNLLSNKALLKNPSIKDGNSLEIGCGTGGVHLNKGTRSTTGNFWSRGMVSFCSNFIPPIYQ